jgi:hypothetical protein
LQARARESSTTRKLCRLSLTVASIVSVEFGAADIRKREVKLPFRIPPQW